MSRTTLLDRARALAGTTALVALPLAAATPGVEAANLLHDYSFSGEYSNSGWFMTGLDDGSADAATQGLGFKLTGTRSVDDGMFWAWNDSAQLTLRRYDVTGIAFAWGGTIQGPLAAGDTITAPFDFTVDFSHTTPAFPQFDDTYVGWELSVGVRDSGYTPEEWQPSPDMNVIASQTEYGSAYEAGSHRFQGIVEFQADDWVAGNATDWFVVLKIDWHDALARGGYEDTQGTLNGDYLTVTIPNQSIDVDIVPATPVPEPGTWATALVGLGLLGLRRRLSRR